ncbi:MAG: hypothetical protein EON95_05545 [Caulobacteraceae bacterium]|nr:MAG: hypothetical protein EON95_05545 [Caulobacteraceae bacterium]
MKPTRLILEEPVGPPTLDLLNSLHEPPKVRERLHTLMALYAFSPPNRRHYILDEVEQVVREAAGRMASELVDLSWTPAGS